MNHETHIQPKQTKKSSQVRISRSHENCRRPQGHPSPSQSGQTSISCISQNISLETSTPKEHKNSFGLDSNKKYTLPPRLKIKKSFEFKAILREKNRLVGKYLCVDIRKAKALRFGISASKKFGISPERNRFKRCVREAFRLSKDLLPQNIEINISPRILAKKAKMQDIRNDLVGLLCKA